MLPQYCLGAPHGEGVRGDWSGFGCLWYDRIEEHYSGPGYSYYHCDTAAVGSWRHLNVGGSYMSLPVCRVVQQNKAVRELFHSLMGLSDCSVTQ